MSVVLCSLFCLLGVQYALAVEVAELPPGPAGYCLEFDGNDSATADPHPALDLAENNRFTLEAWVYRRPEGGSWQVALGMGGTGAHGLTVGDRELLQFELTAGDPPLHWGLETPGGSVPFNTWVHVAGTWDGDIMRGYVNGVERASYFLGGPMVTSGGPFVVGAAGEGGFEGWHGMIDEIRIWNVAHSSAEIQSSTPISLTGDEPGLVAYWQFDEGSGQWAFDSGPNEITLQLGVSETPDDSDPQWVVSEAPIGWPQRGEIRFGHEAYPCSGTGSVALSDGGLVGAGTWEVILSGVTGDFETTSLAEVAAIPGFFEGHFSLAVGSPVVSDGTLQVAHGDVITATYEDADDGTGNPAIATATATVDCVPPVISNVAITNVEQSWPVVNFETDEPTTAIVRYGTDCASLTEGLRDENLATSHQILLAGVSSRSRYFLAVYATDLVGNQTFDDNEGSCYSFMTLDLNLALSFDGNDSACVEHQSVLNLPGELTLEAWVYRYAGGPTWQVALSKGNTNPYGLTVHGDGFLHFELVTS